jgi:hypothetical protein
MSNMSTETHEDPSPSFPLQDVEGDIERAAHVSHDPSAEVAHAREHFYDNARWFLLCFLPIILLTVAGFVINFGTTPMPVELPWNTYHITGNTIAALVLAAARCALIVWFLEHLFKDFSFVFRTLAFTLFFLGGMIYLSLWDSEVKPNKVGNPIFDHQHPESMHMMN